MAARKILLVDDSALIRAVVLHALSKNGVEVTAIEDPRGIADAVASAAPDLILLDATFPGIDHDLLSELVRPHAQRCPIVVFSDQRPDILDALVPKLGAVGCVPKGAGAELWSKLQAFLPEA